MNFLKYPLIMLLLYSKLSMDPHWIKCFHRIKSWFLDWNLGPHLQASVTFSIMVAILSCTTSAVSGRSQGFLNIQLVLASHLFSFSPSYMEQSLHTLNTLPILQTAIQNTQPVTYSILRLEIHVGAMQKLPTQSIGNRNRAAKNS